MSALKLRIGNKLALSAGFGILVLLGIVINQFWDQRVRSELQAGARNAQAVQVAALSAMVATRRMVIMGRDIRAAGTATDVDKTLERAQAFAADADKALESAASAAGTEQGRQRLAGAKDLARRYMATVSELAAAQKAYLAAR